MVDDATGRQQDGDGRPGADARTLRDVTPAPGQRGSPRAYVARTRLQVRPRGVRQRRVLHKTDGHPISKGYDLTTVKVKFSEWMFAFKSQTERAVTGVLPISEIYDPKQVSPDGLLKD